MQTNRENKPGAKNTGSDQFQFERMKERIE